MHKEALYPKTEQVLTKIKFLPILNNFYLAGGTALAIQLGHRKSIDLDFFSSDFPKHATLLQALSDFNPTVTQEAPGTLDTNIDGVVVSFLEYKYPLLKDFVIYEDVKMADTIDIACMKLTAISSRGSKKDFVDLYKIFQAISIDKLMSEFDEKYKGVKYQRLHLLKSVLHFDDAESDPEPDFLEDIKWSTVKRSLENEIMGYMKRLE